MPKINNTVDEYDDDPSNIPGNSITDVKMGEKFHHKARSVANVHKNETPSSINYSMVVSWDSVIIVLTIAALNDNHVLAAKVENPYLSV